MGTAATTFTALFDACVLYPAPLRDLLLSIATTELFRARWTDRIHDEWIRNVLANRPDLKPEQLARTRDRMNSVVLDCLVTGYEDLIAGLTLPDPDDRHVLAAAIRARADVIVTANTRHFPEDYLETFGIHVQHPDEFLSWQFDLGPQVVSQAIREQRLRLNNPPRTVDEFIQTMAQQQLPNVVKRLRAMADVI